MRTQAHMRYTISDVSEITGVAPHTLRFWEKSLTPLLAPYRTPGGQRRYDDRHVALIRDVNRRVNQEHQSLAAIGRELRRLQMQEATGEKLGQRLLDDPVIQQALDEVAEAFKAKVAMILEEREAARPSGDPATTA